MRERTNLNRSLLISIFLLTVGILYVDAFATGNYDGGDGLEGNPFQINTAAQMDEIGRHSEDWNKYFILTADIDLSGYTGTAFHIIGNFTTRFTGSFDGNGHTISNFTYTTTDSDYIGLFGYVDDPNAEIKDLTLTDPDVDVAGHSDYVGCLCGCIGAGRITRCGMDGGSVTGDNHLGGLVGANGGTISNCYATGAVTGDYVIGGLAGWNWGTISNSYATGTVRGEDEVGGLMGVNSGTISNCYATGNVTGDNYVAGLVAYNDDSDIFSSFWDTETSGQVTGVGFNEGSGTVQVYGRTTAQMKTKRTFTDCGWDFIAETENGTDDIWGIRQAVSYPRLWWETIIFVDEDAASANNGTSWADAYNHLQDALSEANSNLDIGEIWVAEGTYRPDSNSVKPNGSGDRTATFQLINGVSIRGGYAGLGKIRDIETYQTILSGDLNGDDAELADPCDLLTEPTRAENSYHVLTASDTNETAVVDGFTIAAGHAGTVPYNRGGGMYNDSGSPTLINCTFSRNSAKGDGGGMYNRYSSPTLTNCMFTGNTAGSEGGGMYNYYKTPTLIKCIFSGNWAKSNGGAMYNWYSNPTLTNCILRGNRAKYGGGMYNWDSPTLTNCLFNGNSAKYHGGGMYNICDDTNPILTNCTFSGNSAGFGGAIYNFDDAEATLNNCILWANVATWAGHEIYLSSYANGGPAPITEITISYSDVQGGQAGIDWDGLCYVNWGDGNIDKEPVFVDADGPDNIIGTQDDNLRLSADSNCIDAGDNTAVPAGVTTDLNGFPRFIDGDYDDTIIVDMGAYEFLNSDINSNGDVDFVDFAVLAIHWLKIGCGDCGSADLNSDGNVRFDDLKAVAENWLAGK